jgi:hypothetical protein
MFNQALVVHTCNSSSQEVEAEGSRVQGQPVLQSETLSQKKKKKKETEIRIGLG